MVGLPVALAAGSLSGIGAAAAFPPLDWGTLAWVALVPLALVARRGGPRAVAVASSAFGLWFFGLLFPWIHLFGMAAYLLLVTLEAAFVAAALTLGTVLRRHLPERAGALAFPVAFVVAEYLRSHLPFGGFPWGGLGYSQHNNALVLHLAAYTGVWGVSFLVALVNALLADGVLAAARRRHWPRAAVPAGLAVALVLAPALLPVGIPRGAAATLAIVQGNAPLQDPADPHALDQEALQRQVGLTNQLAGKKVALVVWPESSVGHDPFSDPSLLNPLLDSIHRVDAPFLVGTTIPIPGTPGRDAGAGRFRNESLFFNSSGFLVARYVKMHLVPFGEYVPGRRLLAGWIKELRRVPNDGVPGARPTVFSIPEGTFASAICYETAYPELVGGFVAHGARMLIISTDNSSYRRSAASAQMVAISQLRAAEQRMWVTQAALTGISAVIAPDGHVVARTGLFTSALLTPTVRFATGTSVYGRFGDWFPVLILLLGSAGIIARPRRTTRSDIAQDVAA